MTLALLGLARLLLAVALAPRFGFTNPSRFLVAYRRRFGEHPNEARRRG